MVVENLAKVEKNICAACQRSGRKREEVTLIAVSKTKPVSMIEELLPERYVEIRIEKNLEKGFDYREITVSQKE